MINRTTFRYDNCNRTCARKTAAQVDATVVTSRRTTSSTIIRVIFIGMYYWECLQFLKQLVGYKCTSIVRFYRVSSNDSTIPQFFLELTSMIQRWSTRKSGFFYLCFYRESLNEEIILQSRRISQIWNLQRSKVIVQWENPPFVFYRVSILPLWELIWFEILQNSKVYNL